MRNGIAGLIAAALVWSGPYDAWAADVPVEAPDSCAATDAPPGPDVVPAPPPDKEPQDPSQVVFAVRQYYVEGNTILESERLNDIFSPFLGPAQHVSDVEHARTAIEGAYREAGYPTVIVVVPEQTIEDGLVRLTVVESTLDAVFVTGNRYVSAERILSKLPSLHSGVLLHEPTVLKELDAVNANPDRQVAPILTPGHDPGTVNLELKVHDRLPLHGSLEWNNRGTPNSPRQRLNASIQYNNLFDRDHSLTVQTTQSPQRLGTVEVYALNYAVPLAEPGNLVTAYIARSNSGSVLDGAELGGISVTGNATVVGARYFFSPASSGPARHQVSVGADYKRLGKSEAEFPTLGGALISSPVTYAPLSLAYTGSRPDASGVTKLSAALRGNISGVVPGGSRKDFAGDPADPINKPGNRQGSTGTFWVLQVSADRSQRLPGGFSVAGTVDGQVANEPLISAEQYFAGGVESVRGYLENESQGDNAVRWSLEVFSPAVSTGMLPPTVKDALQVTVFYDAALQWLLSGPGGLPPGQLGHHGLAGEGVSARWAITDFVQARLDHAWALRNGPMTGQWDRRVHASLKVLF